VVLITNRTELLIIFTAIGKIGAINSMINTDLRGNSLVFSLKRTRGKFIIIGSELINSFIEIKSDLNLSEDQKLFFLPDKDSIKTPDNFINLSQVVEDFPVHNPSTTIDVKTTDPIAYIFTSGTTGFPKAALCIHYRMVGGGCLFGLVISELNPGDTVYVPLPFFHATALTVGWSAALASGAAVAINRKFSVSRFWDDIRRYNATAFAYVGEICRYLINQPPTPNDQNNPVRAIIGNGLRPEIWKAFKKRFNIDIVGELYGGSDNAAVFANLLNFDCTLGMCSSPYAIVKYDPEEEKAVRNVEGFMERVNVGEIGLLLFESKGATEFRGYTDKEATKAKLFSNVFDQGDLWFNTGDLVRDQGCSHAQFIDRLGDTFRWKGHNVSTTEVEEVLNVFDQVLMSTVYGVKIPGTDGRAGMTAIIPSIGVENLDLHGLVETLKKNLPAYAIPIFIRVKSDLATTVTYKIKKIKLKEESFDINQINDPLFVMLPNTSEYTHLTKDIYENIQNQKYRF
jgi:citronellyl-CoA synthetase